MRRALLAAGLAAIVTLAAGAGYLLSREAAPVATTRALAREVPATLPEFTLTDASGQPRSISEWSGQSLLINFWATWCPPCRREIPLLNQLHTRYGPAGFHVVGIAVDFREDVLDYMQGTPIDYPVLIGEQDGLDAARLFGMDSMGFPFTVFTDTSGQIVTVHIGELHEPEAEAILAAVADVNGGKLTVGAARERIERAVAVEREARNKKPT